ncbi:MAG: PQQ-dependent sugar dehydrogenase, partial [Myxococcota bacterium]
IADPISGTLDGVLLDIRDQVNDQADRGLMDIALHPDLDANPYLYAFYVVDPEDSADASGRAGLDGRGNRYAHVVRYELDLSGELPTIVPDSKVILLGGAGQSLDDISGGGALDFTNNSYSSGEPPASDIDPDTGEYKTDYIKVDSLSHAGGALAFGPDGALYISVGDGTSYNYADPRTVSVQDVNSLSGKILRVDALTGQGLEDNPFVSPGDDLSSNSSKVYQLGLRNPYSMTFTDDGDLFISETGWFTYEEINSGPPGANFGWPYYEGGDNGQLETAPGYRDRPEADDFYDAVDAGDIEITAPYRGFSHFFEDPGYRVQAIVGSNSVYTGDKYPDVFQDDYFFTDIPNGYVYSIDTNDRTQIQYITDFGSYGPTNMIQGPDGYMYLLDIDGGRIRRLEIVDPNDPNSDPVAVGDTAVADEDGATVSGNVLDNDTDADDDTLQVSSVAGQS